MKTLNTLLFISLLTLVIGGLSVLIYSTSVLIPFFAGISFFGLLFILIGKEAKQAGNIN